MLRQLLSLTLLCLAASVAAQNGRAVYESSTAIDIDPADLPPGMEAAALDLPTSFDTRAELLFSADASLYRDLVPEPAPEPEGPRADRPQVKFVGKSPEAYHFERAGGRVRQARSVLGKPFHVEDDALALDWRETGATGTDAVTGLPTRAATAVHPDGDTVYADYTPSVAVPYGPSEYTGLPGLIVRLRKGRTTVQLQALDLLDAPPAIQVPEPDGKTLTRERFLALRERKQAALMRQASGPRTTVIRQ